MLNNLMDYKEKLHRKKLLINRNDGENSQNENDDEISYFDNSINNIGICVEKIQDVNYDLNQIKTQKNDNLLTINYNLHTDTKSNKNEVRKEAINKNFKSQTPIDSLSTCSSINIDNFCDEKFDELNMKFKKIKDVFIN